MATKILFIATILYLVTVLFSIFQLPGTLELGIFSIPTVSLLLMRYYRVNFKSERNLLIRYFSLIMSVFISVSLLIPIFFFRENQFENLSEFLMISWMMVIILSLVYYVYYAIRSNGKKNKTGYMIMILTAMIFLVEVMISFSLADYIELKYVTYSSLAILSAYIYFQFLWNKPMPKLELGQTLLIGGMVIYVIDLLYLVLL